MQTCDPGGEGASRRGGAERPAPRRRCFRTR